MILRIWVQANRTKLTLIEFGKSVYRKVFEEKTKLYFRKTKSEIVIDHLYGDTGWQLDTGVWS